ncbi:MAG: phosphoribosylanthranilate isomerase [Verrucomicrobiota bacterium]
MSESFLKPQNQAGENAEGKVRGMYGENLPPVLRVRVKICGITTEADALAAIAAGADALGFNTWSGSKRYLDLKKAQEWIVRLPGFVTRVALCINASGPEVEEVAAMPGIDVLQFHGDETKAFCAEYAAGGRSFIRAIRLGTDEDLDQLRDWSTRQVLVDAAVPSVYGGSGATVEKRLAGLAITRYPELAITLAGGLEPGNVGDLVRELRPYAVDVASGVESAPGRKDWIKMRDFVQAVNG